MSGLHVLVVGYRRVDLLATCLASVERHLPAATVHVWDSSGPATPGLAEAVQARPEVDWHLSETNVGFAAAANALAERAVTQGATTLLLLDPDAELLGPLAHTLAAVAEPGVAAAAPRTDDDGPGRRDFDVAHRRSGLVRALVADAGYAPRLRRTPLSGLYPHAPHDVEGYLTGACLAVDVDAWRAVGPFDEEFFLHGEEADWQRRARRAGWRLRLVDEPGVRHTGHGTAVDDPAAARRSRDLLAASIALNLDRERGPRQGDLYLAGTAVLDRVQRSRRRSRAALRRRTDRPDTDRPDTDRPDTDRPDAGRPGTDRPSVVITVNRLVRGGAERHHVVLARELQRRGHEVVIVCMQRFGPLLADIPPEIRVVRQPWWVPLVDLPDGPAVVIAGDTNTETGWATGWRALGRAQGRDRRWLVGAHVPPDPGAPTYGGPLARAMSRADGFVALSGRHREQVSAHQRVARRWFVAPNGVPSPPSAAQDAPARAPGPARLVMLSRILEHKNPHVLVEALAGLGDLDWELSIHGDGPDRERLQALTPTSLAGRVHWRGWSPGPDHALAGADLLCVPSSSEAFPMVILEAMVRGVPVLASSVCAVPEMLDEGRAGMLVDQVDVEGWRTALRAALAERDRWPALGRAGRARAAEHYTVTAMTDAYEAAIDAVLAGPASTAGGR